MLIPFFWICYLATTLSMLGHYWRTSYTHPMFITVSYLLLTRKSHGILYQVWVSKPSQSPNADWAGTLLVLIWLKCFNPLCCYLHEISMNVKFNTLAKSWKLQKLHTKWQNTKYKLNNKDKTNTFNNQQSPNPTSKLICKNKHWWNFQLAAV